MKRASFLTWEQLRVGALILIALAVLTVAVVRLGQAANLFGGRYTLITFVPNANGLRVGGSVLVAGKLAGTVREIEFLPPDADTTRNLRLVLEIDQALQSQVRGDSRAKLRTLGLLGDKVVDISPGTNSFQALAANDTVPTQPTMDYDAILAQATTAVEDMVQLTADLRSITGGLVRGEGTAGQLLTNRALYDDLTRTLAQTNVMMQRLQNPNGSFGRLISDPALYNNIAGLTARMDTLVGQLNSSQGTLGRLMRDDTLYTRMVSVIGSTDSLLQQTRTGNGVVPKLLNDQELYDRLNKTLTDLNAVLEDVRRNPERYFKGLIKVF
jgi:phospholipid/cholesterol/gamma-HCH transport system substrate-binding protein